MYISIDEQRFRKLVKESNCRKVVNQLGKYGDGLLYLFKIALFTCISVYLFKRTVYHYTVCMSNNECSITLDVAGVPFLTQSVQPSPALTGYLPGNSCIIC